MNIIVALDNHGGYAKDGIIPWSFKADWDWFRVQTAGSYCIMGRKTYEDILDRKCKKQKTEKALLDPKEALLIDRESIVLTRSTDIPAIGVTVYPELRQALEKGCIHKKMPIFILGGEKLWTQALPQVKKVYTTLIDKHYDCTRHFNVDYLNKHFKIVKGEGPTKEKKVALYFNVWERK